MKLDIQSLYVFILVFIRLSTLLMTSQFYSADIPKRVMVLLGVVLSLSFSTVVQDTVGHVPTDLYIFLLRLLFEFLVGALMGYCIQLFFSILSMAGSYYDISLGLAMAQQMNPVTGHQSTIISRFISMLVMATILLMNGHHLMFKAFVDSYQLPFALSIEGIGGIVSVFSQVMSWGVVSAVQIAAPVLALTACIDVASGIVNRSVPMMPIYLVSLPVKIAMGIIILSFGFPVLMILIQAGFEHIIAFVYQIFRVWK